MVIMMGIYIIQHYINNRLTRNVLVLVVSYVSLHIVNIFIINIYELTN